MGRDVLHAGDYQMPTSTEATASLPDEPALLRIEGPIATITLNRPAAFNSIDLSIAKKLEQLGAEVEVNDDIRVLVIEGEGRAFCAGGDLQTIGAAAAANTIAPVVGELLKRDTIGNVRFQGPGLQPLTAEVLHQSLRLGVLEHAPHLGFQRRGLAELAFVGKARQFVIGHAAPQEIRQPRR